MNTIEINNYLKGFKEFGGTYPRDSLPYKVDKPSCFVINTDKADGPGEHWVAIYLYNNGSGEYFDSFGLPPLHTEIIQFLHKNCPKGWYHNSITFQSFYSGTCGTYCVLYLSTKCRGMTFELFINMFNNNKRTNDLIAEILYKSSA